MKKLLLSTLILSSGLMFAPVKIGATKPAATAIPATTVSTPTPAATATPASAISQKLAALRNKIQNNKTPIEERLKALDNNIKEMLKDYNPIADSLLDDQKIDVNAVLDELETEANDLWNKFGGSSIKWYYPTYQSTELKAIAQHIQNIKGLYNKINKTSIIMEPVYKTASWINKNKLTTAAIIFGAFFTSNYWKPLVNPCSNFMVATGKFLTTPLPNPWLAATTVAETAATAATTATAVVAEAVATATK